MKRERNPRPSRKMKPVFLVFHEGETEKSYICFIRKQYKFLIIPHKTGLKISPGIIRRHIQAEKLNSSDKIISFLMYDLDRDDIVKKLEACKGSVRITSNPCVELWFLLHTSEQNAAINTNACLEKLKKSTSPVLVKKAIPRMGTGARPAALRQAGGMRRPVARLVAYS